MLTRPQQEAKSESETLHIITPLISWSGKATMLSHWNWH